MYSSGDHFISIFVLNLCAVFFSLIVLIIDLYIFVFVKSEFTSIINAHI